MTHQRLVLQSFVICLCVLSIVTSKLSEPEPSAIKESDSKSETAQDTESRTSPLSSSSSHRTSKILKPSQIRNRRSNLLTDNEQFFGDNADLDSAFFYSDQIMQNLLKTPKPLNYGRSNFFLNMLKPRTTRYNAWEDHSLMHFGKRSVNDDEEVLRNKRSVDMWLSENPKKLVSNAQNSNESPENEIPNVISEINPEDSYLKDSVKNDLHGDKIAQNTMDVDKKSNDQWHSMMNFGKKSQDLWDPNFQYFSKKDDPWHNTMSFGKRSLDPWDHSLMHFGKKNDPWHNMMSFGKKFDPSIDMDAEKRGDPWHNVMSFGKKSGAWHSMMNFGKRSEYPWDHNTLHFGKRDDPWHNVMSFGKRDDPWHNVMSFGKKSDPWHNVMSFGKRSDYPWDHNTLHFGKKDDPWHNVMSFGKRPDYPWDHNTLHFGKREDPWHNVMSFGKRAENDDTDLEKRGDLWHSTMSFGKRSNPWHSVMSFGKKSDYEWDHNTLHFGKKDDPWHNVMSFGKRMDDDGELDEDKRDDPWHNTMSFGKRYGNLIDDNSTMESKRDDPWHNTMSFGKKSDMSWDHNTLHFGKRDDPWHNVMSFGKKSNIPWGEHNTLHFGKKDDPWHNVMSFGKKSDMSWDHNTLHFGKKNDPWHSMMSFGKRSNEANDYDLEELSNPWEDYRAMEFDKKFEPWDHNTLRFGKKSNGSGVYILSPERLDSPPLRNVQKRSVAEWHGYQIEPFVMKSYPWENDIISSGGEAVNQNLNLENPEKKSDDWGFYNTMHFGKKSDDWGFHNTMHFGKKRNPWDNFNTMHFGKKADPWDFHNTMHFGKRSDDAKDSAESEINLNNMNKFDGIVTEKENAKSKIQTKEDSTPTHKKRSVEVNKFHSTSETTAGNSNKLDINNNMKLKDSQNKKHEKYENSVKISEEDKSGHVSVGVPNKQEISTKERPNGTGAHSSPHKDTKSRIMKRSVEVSKSDEDNSNNPDPNAGLFDDNFPDTVLHFGKRSIDKFGDELSEDLWLDKKEDKRQDYWDSHNTLHFGKKSNSWDGHNTMHFGKRNPWDSYNTLHFGKKSNPWDGHSQMHFGKRSGEWDYNVLHFGKRNEIGNNIQAKDLLYLLLSDPEKLKTILREMKSNGGGNDAETLKLLKNLENFDIYLRDDSISTDEKLHLLESYLEPIFKTIQHDNSLEEAGIGDSYHSANEFLDPNLNRILLSEEGDFSKFPSRTIVNDNVLENEILPFYIENPSYEDRDENSKLIDDLKENKGFLKPKRGTLGKPELKRYFVPFTGPKSIVYPHAWFASQIRRSTQPRTRGFAKTMQMRMAEKKEDPFNSYMHFGRR